MIASDNSRPQTAPAPMRGDAVLEQMDQAVIVTDRDSTIEYFNASAERLLGFKSDQALGCSVLDMGISEEDHRAAVELAREVLRGGTWRGTFCNMRSDGSRIFTRVEAVPRRDADGDVTGTVIFAREALTRRGGDGDERLGLLDRVGRLLAQSLGFTVSLQKVADVLVPQFAEHCFIDLYEPDNTLRRHVLRHASRCDPPSGIWIPRYQEVDYAPGHFCHDVLEKEESVLVEDLRLRYRRTRGNDLCAQAGLRSAVAAPLMARGRMIGVLTLARSQDGERLDTCFDGYDQALIGSVASRLAIAIDNARLFEEERKAAVGFQNSLLPTALPTLDGLETAYGYEPAEPEIDDGVQTRAGGDWYDLIPLSAGRVGIVIGDVEGHGAQAAAIMGQLRAAVRAFAQFDLGPADMIKRLEEWVQSFDVTLTMEGKNELRPPRVSCLYLVYDAWSRQLWYANAGHKTPLVYDGQVRELEVQPTPTLGSGGDAALIQLPEEHTCTFPPGATLVLYTDGLVRWHPQEKGEATDSTEVLESRLAEVADKDVQRVAGDILDAAPPLHDDDVAVLVLRSQRDDLRVHEQHLTSDPATVPEARRQAAEALDHWDVPGEQADVACLLISEVVTNAVRHAVVTPTPRRSPEDAFLDIAASMLDGDALGDGDDMLGLGGFDENAGTAPGEAPAGEGKEEQELVLRLRRGADALWVEVFDQDLRLPRIRVADEDDEGGRGLYLVERLSTRWGSRATNDGKWVWFELAF